MLSGLAVVTRAIPTKFDSAVLRDIVRNSLASHAHLHPEIANVVVGQATC